VEEEHYDISEAATGIGLLSQEKRCSPRLVLS
jgi:hypothetical protein